MNHHPRPDEDSKEYGEAYDEICRYNKMHESHATRALFRLLNYVNTLESEILSLHDELTDRVDAIELRVDADQSRLDSVLEVNEIWDGS